MIYGESLVVTETNGLQNLKSTYYLALYKKCLPTPHVVGLQLYFAWISFRSLLNSNSTQRISNWVGLEQAQQSEDF